MMTEATADIRGRPYAKLNNVRAGNYLELDNDFTCMSGTVCVGIDDEEKLYVPCRSGRHYLDGQLNDAGYLVGMYLVSSDRIRT